jgi:hypothetical protein
MKNIYLFFGGGGPTVDVFFKAEEVLSTYRARVQLGPNIFGKSLFRTGEAGFLRSS